MVTYVGRFPEGLPSDRPKTTLVMLGACNPGGRRRPDGWNVRMMERMRRVLRRFHFIEASGSLNRWREPMLMVTMEPSQACVIARRFKQNAIIVIARRRRTRLLILSENIPNITV